MTRNLKKFVNSLAATINFVPLVSICVPDFKKCANWKFKKGEKADMPIPAYMWLKDDGGADIKGSASVQGREGSIEVIGFGHGLNLPVDRDTGKVTGTRSHSPMMIEKEFDSSSPYLYKAVAKGQTLASTELKWYRINDAGREEVYFIMLLEGVKVTGIHPGMTNTKISSMSQLNHMESVAMMYDRITWHYTDGNIKFTDSWGER